MMPVFTLLCHDKDDGLATRMETRPVHLDYIASAGEQVLLAGALLNEAGEPAGSLLIIEAEDANAAKAFADNDPYAKAGVFNKVDIAPYRIAAGALAPKS